MPDYMDAMLGISGSGEDEQEELAKRLRSQNQLANVMSMSGHKRARGYGDSLRKNTAAAAKGHVAGRKERRGEEEYDRTDARSKSQFATTDARSKSQFEQNMDMQGRRAGYEEERIAQTDAARSQVELFDPVANKNRRFNIAKDGTHYDIFTKEPVDTRGFTEPEARLSKSGRLREQRAIDTGAKNLSYALQKADIPTLDAAVGDLTSALTEDAKDKNLAGIGHGSNLPFAGAFVGTEGRKMKSKIAKVRNLYLAERSGAAVTTSEAARLIEELSTNWFSSEEEFLTTWKQFQVAHRDVIRNLAGSASPEMLAQYKTNSRGKGVNFDRAFEDVQDIEWGSDIPEDELDARLAAAEAKALEKGR